VKSIESDVLLTVLMYVCKSENFLIAKVRVVDIIKVFKPLSGRSTQALLVFTLDWIVVCLCIYLICYSQLA
jgi:hypothetical protein